MELLENKDISVIAYGSLLDIDDVNEFIMAFPGKEFIDSGLKKYEVQYDENKISGATADQLKSAIYVINTKIGKINASKLKSAYNYALELKNALKDVKDAATEANKIYYDYYSKLNRYNNDVKKDEETGKLVQKGIYACPSKSEYDSSWKQKHNDFIIAEMALRSACTVFNNSIM